MRASWFAWLEGDLRLRLHVQPRASKDEIIGPHGDALKIRITAPPVEGAANAHLVRFLAKEFKVQKQQVNILGGDTGRRKLILIKSPTRYPKAIAESLGRL